MIDFHLALVGGAVLLTCGFFVGYALGRRYTGPKPVPPARPLVEVSEEMDTASGPRWVQDLKEMGVWD